MTPAFYYLSQGDFANAILWVMNDYIGYGIIWLCLGIAIFGTLYQKSKSYALSGFGFTMFLSMVNYLLPVEVQSYFTVLIALMLFGVVYRVIR